MKKVLSTLGVAAVGLFLCSAPAPQASATVLPRALTPAPCPDCKDPASGKPGGTSPYVFPTAFACDLATGARQWTVRFGVSKNTVVPKHKAPDGNGGFVVVPAHKPAQVLFSYIVTSTTQTNLGVGPMAPGSHQDVAITSTAPSDQIVELDVLGYEVADHTGYAFFDKAIPLHCTCDKVPVTSVVPPPPSSPVASSTVPTVSSSPVPGSGKGSPGPGPGTPSHPAPSLPATGSNTRGLIEGGLLLGLVGGLFVWSARRKRNLS